MVIQQYVGRRTLVHNHPSGDPTPSRADVQMTQQIVDAISDGLEPAEYSP